MDDTQTHVMEEEDSHREDTTAAAAAALLFPVHKLSQFASPDEESSQYFPVGEGQDSEYFAREDQEGSHFGPALDQGESRYYPGELDQGSQFPADEDSQFGPGDDKGSLFPAEDNPSPSDDPDMDAQTVQVTGDLSAEKRKLAVFAAAGAVISIQTALVAMPEIWQPLQDDDSSENVAYQEGLHSWFGALNRAAWLHSTSANGAGDGGGWWVKPRASVWFNTYLMRSNEDERWVSSIRMKRRTFLWICNNLEVHVRKQDTRLRPSIPVTVRVGATLYRLVNGSDYHEVADKFGVGESSVHEIIQDCVPAIVKVFGHHLPWPGDEAMAEVSKGFFQKCGLPNCHGAVGSTHVEILNPTGPEAKKYLDRTGHFSIVLQAVADTAGSFLDVSCGYPEGVQGNRVLRNSTLYDRAVTGEILAGPIQTINGGFQLRPYLLGGPKYPLFPWLIVPYPPSPHFSHSQEQFVNHHEQGRLYTQQAFDILKRLFRVLGVGIRGRLELAPTIVQACCLLHNILIKRKEVDVQAELENIRHSSDSTSSLHIEENIEEGSSDPPSDASSLEIRDQLAEFLVWDG